MFEISPISFQKHPQNGNKQKITVVEIVSTTVTDLRNNGCVDTIKFFLGGEPTGFKGGFIWTHTAENAVFMALLSLSVLHPDANAKNLNSLPRMPFLPDFLQNEEVWLCFYP